MSCSATNPVLDAIGATLIGKNGEVATADALKGKSVLGLYFSAHWCPPCRAFTPELSKKYTALQEAGKDFELVFVSSDRNQKGFDEYHAEMSFLALPFSNRDGKEELSEMFEVEGIPTLVFVDTTTGKLITDDGRKAISKDSFLEDYPYRPKPFNLMASLGDSLKTKEGTVKTTDALAGKDVLGLYFSAHWCPPCRGFTPVLSKKYTELREAGKSFELVFVSSDKDESAFNDYHSEMSFFAKPFSDRKGKEELSEFFKVQGIPSLVFWDLKEGKLITSEGRSAITASSFVQDFPYHPKPVNDLGVSMSGINDKKSLILFMEDSSAAEQKEMTATLTAVAEEEKKKPDGEQAVQCWFTATGEGPVNQIRANTKMPLVAKPHEHELKEEEGNNWGCDGCGKAGSEAKKRWRCTKGCDFDFCGACKAKSEEKAETRAPSMLILHLGAGGKYYKSEAPITAESIKAFVADFAGKKLTAATWGK